MAKDVLNNRLLIRRITTLKAVRSQDSKRELIGFIAECNHSNPPERKMYPISQWGQIAYELAEDWALNHKCRGDDYQAAIKTVVKEIARAPRRLQSVR